MRLGKRQSKQANKQAHWEGRTASQQRGAKSKGQAWRKARQARTFTREPTRAASFGYISPLPPTVCAPPYCLPTLSSLSPVPLHSGPGEVIKARQVLYKAAVNKAPAEPSPKLSWGSKHYNNKLVTGSTAGSSADGCAQVSTWLCDTKSLLVSQYSPRSEQRCVSPTSLTLKVKLQQ